VTKIVVPFDGKSYVWDGKQWYGEKDFVMPPLAIVSKLEQLVKKQSAVEKKVANGV